MGGQILAHCPPARRAPQPSTTCDSRTWMRENSSSFSWPLHRCELITSTFPILGPRSGITSGGSLTRHFCVRSSALCARGGQLWLATDYADYFDVMLAALETSSCLVEVDAELAGCADQLRRQVPRTGQADLPPSHGEDADVKIPAELKQKGVGPHDGPTPFLCQCGSREEN